MVAINRDGDCIETHRLARIDPPMTTRGIGKFAAVFLALDKDKIWERLTIQFPTYNGTRWH